MTANYSRKNFKTQTLSKQDVLGNRKVKKGNKSRTLEVKPMTSIVIENIHTPVCSQVTRCPHIKDLITSILITNTRWTTFNKKVQGMTNAIKMTE